MGFTAQVLFVLSSHWRAVADFAYLKSDQTYRTARKVLYQHKQLGQRSIEKDNSSIPDPMLASSPANSCRSSTFLWFPWTLLELTQLSLDKSLSEEERALRCPSAREILNANAERLETTREAATSLMCFGREPVLREPVCKSM